MTERGTTHLRDIPHHSLYIECVCGRGGNVRIADLLANPALVTVAVAVARSRCSACGARMVKDYRIIYEGASDRAMDGARSAQDEREG